MTARPSKNPITPGTPRFSENAIRLILTILALLVQLAAFVLLVIWFTDLTPVFVILNGVLSVILILVLLNNDQQINYKFTWIIVIAVMPIFGTIFYLLFGGSTQRPRMRRLSDEVRDLARPGYAPLVHLPATGTFSPDQAAQVRYLNDTTGCPPTFGNRTRYLSTGEAQFEVMKEMLLGARRYILMEYFIIYEGSMWDEIFAILQAKSAEGVEIRIIYDDLGSIKKLPHRFEETLNAIDVKVTAFNRFTPKLSLNVNNRDHRKMLVTDGEMVLTGGINIAEEYINRWARCGYWKDTGIVMEGPAAWSYAVMFLSLWQALNHDGTDILSYLPPRFDQLKDRHPQSFRGISQAPIIETAQSTGDACCQPFDDMPFDGKHQAAAAYRNLIGRATKTLDIMTPYLVMDDEMINCILTASNSGVRVRIITPHIPDKPYVLAVGRSYYQRFLEHGVEIYEFTPGFVHGKSAVVDSSEAIIGTVNFDYRSLYLHLECATWLNDREVIRDMDQDFSDTIAVSQTITLDEARDVGFWTRLSRSILRAFAPLM